MAAWSWRVRAPRLARWLAACAGGVCGGLSSWAQPSLRLVQNPEGERSTLLTQISGDGSVAVGVSTPSGRAVRVVWRVSERAEAIPGVPVPALATAASADGSVIVGVATFGGQQRAFRYSAAGTVNLGLLIAQGGAADFSRALGVSADGETVVGVSTNGAGATEAFSWSSGAGEPMRGLGYLADCSNNSVAQAISGDGGTVVGRACRGSAIASESEAFAYALPEGPMQGLGALASGFSSALGVSADGTTTVGESSVGDGYGGFITVPFMYTAAEGMRRLLGPCDQFGQGRASDVSGDGSVIVGSYGCGGSQAFVHTRELGVVYLGELLASVGVQLSEWELVGATGISDDGKVVIGTARSTVTGETQGFIAELGTLACIADFNRDGTVDVGDFFAYLLAFSANEHRADLDQDKVIDVNDFFVFLSAYSVGCS